MVQPIHQRNWWIGMPAHYPYVKAVHQVNQGLAIARNSGLEVASGEYVAFVDSDDWIEPDQLVALYRQAKLDALDMILGYGPVCRTG